MKKICYFIITLLVGIFLISCEKSHEHSYSETFVEATCEEKGYIEYKCECGDSFKDNFIDEKGHSFNEWIVVKEATELEEGLKERACSCGEKETLTIDKLEHSHNFGEWVITKEATDLEVGLKERVCLCGEKESLTIDKLDHEHSYISGKCACGDELQLINVTLNIDDTIDVINVYVNEKVQKPVEPLKEKYIFDGWYLDSEYNNKYDFENVVTEDITLYAKFIYNYVTVSYPNLDKSLYPTTEVEIGSTYVLPEVLPLDGFIFIGWFYDNKYINKIEGDSFVVDGNTSNITIYPGYKEYIKINNIITEVPGDDKIIKVENAETNEINSRKVGVYYSTPKYYGLTDFINDDIKVTIKLKNSKNDQVAALKIHTEDSNVKVLINGEYVSSSNGEFIIDNTSGNNDEVVFYVKLNKSVLTIIKIIDFKVNGEWQEYQLSNNELYLFRLDNSYFVWNIAKLDESNEYAVYIDTPDQLGKKFTLNGKEITCKYNLDKTLYHYVITEGGKAIYSASFYYNSYEITMTISREIVIE